ncbi:MAG TPA: bifunctional folylpolyglutamate synthase/dihydrofolate synthase [Candidatus Blautia stercoravium]|nr:bifunctional folylpolyglutamate synthase/dihydrofolate synthase [Candidatus Blautia stercoravium]
MFTYEEAVDYIENIPKFTTKNKLEHTRKCLDLLGSPDKDRKIIHVAGTNGKGSVCAFLSSMLEQGGFRCGLFTSPHLVKINERFQINEVMISDQRFTEAFTEVKKLSDRLVEEGDYHPTYFEFLFLMGMIVFKQEDVDYIVLETGLGGRLDATNSVLSPMACVITSISLDHVEYLGDTIEKIAGEKAGIIKKGVPVIFDGNRKEAAEVIRARAEELGCPWYEVKENQQKLLDYTPEGIRFLSSSGFYGETELFVPFIARYQMMNTALALETMGVLKGEHGLEKEVLVKGIGGTKWQGRMETILPGVVVDGAHNEDGIARFVETVSYFQKEYPITLLFSTVADKEFPDMIKRVCEGLQFANVVTTEIWGSRKQSAKELAELFRLNGCSQVFVEPNPGKAFDLAYKKKGDGLLFVAGSLYLAGEIKDYVRRNIHD